MSSLFDFEPKTDQYTVMGNPISHSKSPFIHTLFAKQTRQNIQYNATQVDPGGFEQAIGNFQASGGKGLNITVPFKQEAWKLVNTRSQRAELAGAVNTILFKSDKTLFGDNTDGIGLVKDLTNNHQCTIKGKRILVLGAGGAVRGILMPLLEQRPALITIVNRTIEKTHTLVQLYKQHGNILGNNYNDISGQQFDLIINGTSASLKDELPPLPENIMKNNTWCYDMMYGKDLTIFLRWGEQHQAAKLIDGLGMLVEQAAESFYLWRGLRPDTQEVIKEVRKQM